MTTEHRPQGVFGGTFDPVHFGHLRLAQEALDHLQLASVRWIPAGQPTHRNPPQAAPEHRLKMAELALDQHPQFRLDPAEIDHHGPSYTVLTLERLRRELGPQQPLVLLLGADAFLRFDTWFRWQDILELAHLGIAHRPGSKLQESALPPVLADAFRRRHRTHAQSLCEAPAGKMVSFAMTPLDISSTQIRHLHRQQHAIRYLLPEKVLDYIDQHHLYP